MITRVMGKVTETFWHVEPNNHEEMQDDGTAKVIFDKRPELKSNVRKLEPVEICRYEGEPKHDYDCLFKNSLYIEEKRVYVDKCLFYADLDEYRQFVDKVVTNTDINYEESRVKYELLLRDYNRQVIEGDEKLLAYCRLHHLDPEETDVDELRKVVYPQNTYKFSWDISADDMNITTSDTIAKVMA